MAENTESGLQNETVFNNLKTICCMADQSWSQGKLLHWILFFPFEAWPQLRAAPCWYPQVSARHHSWTEGEWPFSGGGGCSHHQQPHWFSPHATHCSSWRLDCFGLVSQTLSLWRLRGPRVSTFFWKSDSTSDKKNHRNVHRLALLTDFKKYS